MPASNLPAAHPAGSCDTAARYAHLVVTPVAFRFHPNPRRVRPTGSLAAGLMLALAGGRLPGPSGIAAAGWQR